VTEPETRLYALQNLAANAVKFSAPGDTVEVRASEDGSWVLLEVADTGTGLALVRVVVTRHGGQTATAPRFPRHSARLALHRQRSNCLKDL
jgi:signal transduction histidine kinase